MAPRPVPGTSDGPSGGPTPLPAARQRHILFVVNADWYFVSHRLELARSLVRSGWRVTVATQVGESAGILRDAGCEVYPLAWRRRGLAVGGNLTVFRQLVRLLRAMRPDVVHTVALKAVVFAGAAMLIARAPAAVHAIAGFGYAYSGAGLARRLVRAGVTSALRMVFRRPRTRVVVQNPDDRRFLVDLRIARPSDVVVIRGAGVDLQRFSPAMEPPRGTPIVVLPARMLWDKGVGEFVEAARMLRARAIEVRCVLVGGLDPQNRAGIRREQVEAWTRGGTVEWWGHAIDMPAVYRQATLAVLPSYREGLPKALIEAAACGLPIVATDVPGCREIAVAGVNGLLVPPRDPAALADAMARLLLDREYAAALGRRGRGLAQDHFADDHVIAATRAVYEELLAPADPDRDPSVAASHASAA